MAGFPILGNPGRCVPQEEGSRVFLLTCRVDLLGDAGRSLCGGRINGVNPVEV